MVRLTSRFTTHLSPRRTLAIGAIVAAITGWIGLAALVQIAPKEAPSIKTGEAYERLVEHQRVRADVHPEPAPISIREANKTH